MFGCRASINVNIVKSAVAMPSKKRKYEARFPPVSRQSFYFYNQVIWVPLYVAS